MQIYFFAKAIPELADLPPGERRLAWYACRKYVRGHWQTWVGTAAAALVGLAAGAAAFYGIILLLEGVPILIRYFVGGFVSGSVIVGVTEYLRGVVVSSQIRPYLRHYLKEREARKAPQVSNGVEIEYASAPFEDEGE